MPSTDFEYLTGSITGANGVTIGYRQMGGGPAVILVHGAMMTSQSFMRLAQMLADKFTVYIPDRRGRLSSPYSGNDLGLATEAADIKALVEHTGAQRIFGLSSGAVLTLQVALLTPSITKVALYEPPLPDGHVNDGNWYEDYENAIAKQRHGRAFVSLIRGTTRNLAFRIIPLFITAPLMGKFVEKHDAKPGDVKFKELLPTFRNDYRIVSEAENLIDEAKNLKADVLLLSGSKSPRYLKDILKKLGENIRRARLIEFEGVGHTAADNNGKPEMVAAALKIFFAE